MNLPPLQPEGRLKQVKAAVTVAMAVITYFIYYVPAIDFVFWSRNADVLYNEWIAFLANFCTFISSSSDPINNIRTAKQKITRFHQAAGERSFGEQPVSRDASQK